LEYFPRTLILTKPAGESIFEFIIESQPGVGAFCSLLKVFADHKIDVKSIAAGPEEKDNEDRFLTSAFCDFSHADCTVDAFKAEVAKLPFVKRIASADMKGKLFDQFIFPMRIMSDTRVIIFRVEPLLNIERNLVKRLGSAGAALMFEEGKSYSEKVVNQYKTALPSASTEDLLLNIKDGLRATGWGLFDFRRISSGFEVTVIDPPFDDKGDYNENRFYYGVVCRVLEMLHGVNLVVSESDLNFEKRKLVFRLLRS
jgi:hypothetical protein